MAGRYSAHHDRLKRRNRGRGDARALQTILWTNIVCLAELSQQAFDDGNGESVRRYAHALSQIGGTYARLLESAELEARVKQLEELARHAKTNGHATARH